MKLKELEKNLIKEGKCLTPNKIEDIYQKLGISFLDEKVNNSFIEQKIKKEGNILLENVKPEIVKKEDEWSLFYERKIGEEKRNFLPDMRNKLGIKKENRLLAFFKNKATIAFSSAFAIAIICTSVVLTNALNKQSFIDGDTSNTDTSNNNHDDVVNLAGKSTVNFKLESGSKAYKPEVIYAVETTSYINSSSIVAVNDSSKNILSSFSQTSDNNLQKLASNNAYTISSFTNKYLNIALNLGYIERKDASKINEITLSINYGKEDESYYKNLIKELEDSFENFIYENKIVARFTVNESASEAIKDELTQLITQAYEISINLFVDENGNINQILCFSTELSDWLEKYKNYSIEDMQEYVDYLIRINEKISNDENKALFIARLSECTEMQNRIETLNEYYAKLSSIYDELIPYLDDVDKDMTRPGDGKDDYEWDWWDDVGHGHHGRKENRRYEQFDEDDDFDIPEGGDFFTKQYDDLILELDALIARKDTINVANKKEVQDYIFNVCDYSWYLNYFYNEYSEFLDEKLESLLEDLDGDKFNNGKPQHHDNDEDDRPDDWDDDFDDWWNSRGGRHH